ncbi:hypothetical protein FQN54_005214 [Arachnomyces sp. PD_36]|nr:hypothetical protein FQN54_005214 [Arachnomyces sp. PD_36]
MSGAEIFQIVASAITVAKLTQKTIRLIRDSQNVDDNVLSRELKIRSVHRIVRAVKKLGEHRQELKGDTGLSRDEQTIWRHLNTSLESSNRLLCGFYNALGWARSSSPGVIPKLFMELRLAWDREELENFDRKLDAQLQAIQLWLLSLQVFSSDENHQQVMEQLGKIHGLVQHGRHQLYSKQSHNNASEKRESLGISDMGLGLSDREPDFAMIIADYVNVGERVLRNYDESSRTHLLSDEDIDRNLGDLLSDSERDDDFNGTPVINRTQARSRLKAEGELIDLETPPAPTESYTERNPLDELLANTGPGDFFTRKPPSHLDNLIKAAEIAVSRHEANRDYESALRDQDARIELLEERDGVEFEDREGMLEMKASFLLHLGRFSDAIEILEELLDIRPEESVDFRGENRSAKAHYFFLLGTAYLEHYKSMKGLISLRKAEKFAQWAFNGRVKLFREGQPIGDECVQSAELCAKVFEEKGDMARADGCRRSLVAFQSREAQPQMDSLEIEDEEAFLDENSNRELGMANGHRASSGSTLQPRRRSPNISTQTRSESSVETGSIHRISEPTATINTSEINTLGGDGKTPLIKYISEGNVGLVRIFLTYGADVYKKCVSGTPPIIYATKSGSEEIVDILLKRGAKLDETDAKGSNALHVAISRKNEKMVNFLLERGAKRNSGDGSGLPPLVLAVKTKKRALVEILLDNGADVGARTRECWSVLHYAVSANVPEMVGLLRDAGADIDATCTGGKTPLHYACEADKVQCVKELLDLGASITIEDERGRDPLCLAVQHKRYKVVRLLLEKGAEPSSSIDKNAWKTYEKEYARVQNPKSPPARLGRPISVSTANTQRSTGSSFSIRSGFSSRFKSKRTS